MNDVETKTEIKPCILHHVHGRYLIFEVETLRHLREVHHICGVVIGTLPQISQQNVFLGLPQEIMIEEAAYLVRHGHARVIDDEAVHRETIASITADELTSYESNLMQETRNKEEAIRALRLQKKKEALEKRGLTHLLEQLSVQDASKDHPSDVISPKNESKTVRINTVSPRFIYKPPQSTYGVDVHNRPLPSSARYNLFAHLHEQAYFLTPGLRFGAQFVAYPGDPLRFHSHFVASGHDWEAPIALMDIIGGGRLGTGVKKAWLVGAQSPEDQEMKCFTVEWAGM